MEILKNYLETMFQQLPNTPETQKAKDELWQMMEDKYQELIDEGKTQNDAIGTVISEFGNLDELASDLGIQKVVQNTNNSPKESILKLDEVKQYIHDRIRYGYFIGIGVFLCITSVCGPVLFENISSNLEVIGVIYMFLSITIAVGLFVFNGINTSKWNKISKDMHCIDFSTAQYVKTQKENFRMTKSLMITIGVILCITSVIPVIVLEEISSIKILSAIGPILMFIFIGIAVFLFIIANIRDNTYSKLLWLNKGNTLGANFVTIKKDPIYTNDNLNEIMPIYWTIITCMYISISFLTFKWNITWIIWIIGCIVKLVIDNMYIKKQQ